MKRKEKMNSTGKINKKICKTAWGKICISKIIVILINFILKHTYLKNGKLNLNCSASL